MRRIFCAGSGLVLLIGLVACASGPEAMQEAMSPTLVIEGELVGGTNQTLVLERAGKYVGFTFEEIATAAAEEGQFRFMTQLEAPELLYLSIQGEHGNAPIYLGNETVVVRVALDGETPTEVVGSEIHQQFRAFREAHAEAEDAVGVAEEELASVREGGDEAQIAVAQEARDKAEVARVALALDWLEQSRDSTLGPYIGIRHLALQMDVDEIEPMISVLDPALAGTRYYDQLSERLEALRLVTVGTTAPDFSGPAQDGAAIALSSLRGNVVLIDFWASWCGPCRVENPELIALYEEHHDDGFEILGVGLEFQRQPWLDAIETDALPWLNVSDVRGFDTEAAQTFAIRSLPANILLDRDGVIIAKDVHGAELKRWLADVF